jgi:hypothetical protein
MGAGPTMAVQFAFAITAYSLFAAWARDASARLPATLTSLVA